MNPFLYKQVEDNTNDIPNKAELSNPIIYAISAGTGSAYSVTVPKPENIIDGLTLMIKIHETNTIGAALSFNGSAMYPIYMNDVQIEPGNLVRNTITVMRFNGSSSPSYWEVISSGGGGGTGSGMAYAVTTGTSDYLVNIPNGPVLGVGTLIALSIHRDSVSNQMINYNGNGSKPLRINNVNVSARQIKKDTLIIICYDGTDWELFSGGNSMFYLGDIDFDDMSFVLNEEKYFIDTDIVQGSTNMSFIGGQIDSFDPTVEEMKFFINGIFQVPNTDYILNDDNSTLTLIGKTGVYGNTHTYIIRKKIISVNIENELIDIVLNRTLWVQSGGIISQEVAVTSVKPSSDVLFTTSAGANSDELFEFSRRGVKCIELKNNAIVVTSDTLPTIDIPVMVFIMR